MQLKAALLAVLALGACSDGDDVIGGGGAAGESGSSGSGGSGAMDSGGGDMNPYASCADPNECPVVGSTCDAQFGCQPPCAPELCPPPPGGNVIQFCTAGRCRLDCTFGKTCPDGMQCHPVQGFCTAML